MAPPHSEPNSEPRVEAWAPPRVPAWLYWWVGALVFGAVAAFPLDPVVAAWFDPEQFDLGGDPRRELEALQQYGQLSVTLLLAWTIWQLDPARRRLLLDLGLAKAMLGLLIYGLKYAVGRARPSVGDPWLFAGPVRAEDGPSWAELASMPSGHTAHAALVSVILAMWYPALRPVCIALAVIVGVARVVTGAHYPSDVFLGAALGTGLGWWVASGYRGVRLLDAVWVRLIDRAASPAFPALLVRLGRPDRPRSSERAPPDAAPPDPPHRGPDA